MGLGLLDGTQLWTNFDASRFGNQTTGCTRGIAAGYVATSATTMVKVRATSYVPQGVAAGRSMSSANANDTSAGTGARTVTISYLTTGFVLKQEVVTLSGTTPVNTVNTDIAYIEAMQVTTSGSDGGNDGTISLFTGTGGTGSVWGSIAATDNQTFWCQHYVPTGVTCYLLSVEGGATATAGAINLNHGNPNPTAVTPQYVIGAFYPHGGPGNVLIPFTAAIPIVGPDFIFVNEKPANLVSSTTYASFEYLQF